MARYSRHRRRYRKSNGWLKKSFTSPVRRNAILAGMAIAFISTGWRFGQQGVAYGQALASRVKGVLS